MATVSDEYHCTLDEQTLEKARKELGEKENTRLIEVDALRKRLGKVSGLAPRTDASFLLRFLRVRKFDQEAAFESVKNFYDMKRKHPEIFEDLVPTHVKHMLDVNYMEVLKERDKDGCRVVILRAANWDEDRYTMLEPFRVYVVCLLKVQQEEENQVNGLHFVFDLGGVTWKQAMHWTPSVTKLGLDILQAMVPMRLRRVDYVRQPQFFNKLFPMFKQFMKKKIVNRIFLNDGTYSKLHASIDPEHLPKDLGGQLEPGSYKEWYDELLNSDLEYAENNKYGYVSMEVDNKTVEKGGENAQLRGLGGTFKKLEL